MHISLTGNLGSGKSTITKIMSEKYGYEIYSTGKIIRGLAEERGLTVLQMNELMGKDHSYDHIIDDTTHKISIEQKEDIFFDSRLAWHFAENTYKVFLSVDIDEAAHRVYRDNRGEVEAYSSEADAKKQLLDRAHNEDARYKEIYGINYFQISNYNLILDSTNSSPDTLAEIIVNEKKKYEDAVRNGETPTTKVLLSPYRFFRDTTPVNNGNIYDSNAKVLMQIDGYTITEGVTAIEEAARLGFEFVSLTDALA